MAPDNLLYVLASDIMEAVVDGLTAAGVEIPARRYLHAGQVALDAGPGITCADQLVVTFLPGDFQGLPGLLDESALVCEQPATAMYEVWLSRCVPILKNNKPPTEAELDAAALKTMQDAREVWRAIYLGHKDGTLFDNSPCKMTRMRGGRVQGPEGGVTSYIVGIEVSLV